MNQRGETRSPLHPRFVRAALFAQELSLPAFTVTIPILRPMVRKALSIGLAALTALPLPILPLQGAVFAGEPRRTGTVEPIEPLASALPERLPLVWWKLDEARGDLASSAGWWQRSADLHANTDWVRGKLGGALSFDGREDYASAPTPAGLRDALSLSLWLKPKAGAPSIRAGLLGQAGAFSLRLDQGRPTLALNIEDVLPTNPTCIASEPLAQGVWYHLAGTYGASDRTLRLYVNGELECSLKAGDGQGGHIAESASPLELGRRTPRQGYFMGSVDDVRLYGRVLSSAEIAEILEAETQIPAPLAPENLNAEAMGPKSIVLTWSVSSSEEAGFILERRSARSRGRYQPFLHVGTGETTAIDESAEPYTTYSYRVRAYGPGGFSPYSKEVGVRTLPEGAAPDPEPPLAWWKLDEERGFTAEDHGSVAQDGRVEGEARWTRGVLAGALQLDGETTRVEVESRSEYELDGAFTLSGWVEVAKPSDLANPAIVGMPEAFALRLRGASTVAEVVIQHPDAPEADESGYVSCRGAAPMARGWHHVAGVKTEGDLQLFVDGEEVCRKPISGPTHLPASSRPLSLGYWAPSRSYFAGKLDDIKIYSRALTPEEIFSESVEPLTAIPAQPEAPSPAPVPPMLAAIDPAEVPSGNDTVTLTLIGDRFFEGSTVRVDGAPLRTSFVSPKELKAEMAAAVRKKPGKYAVDVYNPGPGGGVSSSLPFSVTGLGSSQSSFQDGVAPTTAYNGTRDTYINQNSPNTNVGTSTRLEARKTRSFLVRWDLAPAGIPKGSKVSAASITFYVSNSSANTYELYEVKRNWVETEATWQRYASGSTWQTAGVKGSKDRGSTVLGVLTASSTGSYTVPLNSSGVALVESWIADPSRNNGIIVQDYSNSDALSVYSSEDSSKSRRPRLTIDYNQSPVASDQSVNTDEDTAVPIILKATDGEGDALTYRIVSEPANGVLRGTPPNVTYLPAPNQNGRDSFKFVANDGVSDSNVATVTIDVTPVQDPVVIEDRILSLPEDTPRTVELQATGGDGPLSFQVVSQPAQGLLTGTPPLLTYAPVAGFNGIDSFRFSATDGQSEAQGTVYLVVGAVNQPPVAQEQRVVTERNTPVTITLRAVDPDGQEVDFLIELPPEHGTLSGLEAERLYAPEPGFAGIDTFTFKASDGALESAAASVTVVVGHPAAYRIIDLGTLGGENSSATGINAESQVVGRADLPSSKVYHPFLLTPLDTNHDGLPDRWYQEDPASGANALMLDLMPWDPSSGVAEGINVRSDVVGTASPVGLGAGKAFRWREGVLKGLFMGVAREAHPIGVVGAREPMPFSPARAVLYNPESDRFVELGAGLAEAINDGGVVVGYIIPPSGPMVRPVAFRFFDSDRDFTLDPGELELLGGPLGFVGSAAHDINASGEIAGSAAVTLGATRAYRVTFSPAPIWTELGTLGGDFSQALAINARSQIVGLATLPRPVGSTGSRQHAFLWESGVLRDLNFLIDSSAGLELELATDINDRQEIVGEAVNREGRKRAVLLLPDSLPSRAPLAVIKAQPVSGEAPLEVQFDGQASSDPDPEDQGTLRFSWDFGDGTTASGSTAAHRFMEPGTYRVVLWVTDSWNIQSAAQVLIAVTPPPEPPAPPIAIISANPSSGPTPLIVTFDGSGSTSGQPIVSYDWTFGDGTSGAGAVVQHTYVDGGVYSVTLVIRDQNDLVATSTTSISAGSTESGVWTWGVNTKGQLGDGTTADRLLPNRVPGLSGVAAIAAGGEHTLALKTDGSVWAWGWNQFGQLGDGTSTNRSSPVQVMLAPGQPLTSVTSIDAGQYHSLALRNDGTVLFWGVNVSEIHLNPVKMDIPYPVTKVDAGYAHSLAVATNGSLWAWGEGSSGQLGTGSPASYSNPVNVPLNFNDVVAVAGGLSHSLALRSDGTVWVWGTSNELRYDPFAVQVPGLNGVTALAAGELYSVVLKSNGSAWAWGVNTEGQLGDGTTVTRQTPVPVATATTLTAVHAFYRHSVARASDGTLLSWGQNTYGQLGDGTTTNRTTPVPVAILSGANHVRSGIAHSVALTVGPPLVLPPIIDQATVTPSDAEGNGLGYVNAPGGPTQFQFTVAASDPNGEALSYHWDFNGDGAIDCTASTCDFTYTQAGHYTAVVTVTDPKKLEAKALLQVNVHPYVLPSAAFVFQVVDGLSVHFDGSSSRAVAGTSGNEGIVSYAWTFGDGTTEETGLPTVEHRYPKPGTYVATLQVKNTVGLTAEASAAVSVDYADDLFDQLGANDTRVSADPLLPVPNVLDPDKGYGEPVAGKTRVTYQNSSLVLKPGNEDWYTVEIPAGGDDALEVSATYTGLLDGTPATGAPDLHLYDGAGALVSIGANGVLSTQNLGPGTYSIRVFGTGPTPVPQLATAELAAPSSPRESSPGDLSQSTPESHEVPPAVQAIRQAPERLLTAALGTTVLYDQYNNPGTFGALSQDFLNPDPNFQKADSYLRDDFVVPPGEVWKIETIEVAGEFEFAAAPALQVVGVSVVPVIPIPGQPPCSFQVVATVLGKGSLQIPFLCSVTGGQYWLQVNAVGMYPPVWYWTQTTVPVGLKAQWKNPGNWYGTGCIDWTDVTACLPTNDSAQMFRLLGKKDTGGTYILGLDWLLAAIPISSSVDLKPNESIRIPLLARTRFGEALTPNEYDAVIVEPAATAAASAMKASLVTSAFERKTPVGVFSYDPATETILYVPTSVGLDEIVFGVALPGGYMGSSRATLSITVEPQYELTEIEPPPLVPSGDIESMRFEDINEDERIAGEIVLKPSSLVPPYGAFVWGKGEYIQLQTYLLPEPGFFFDSALGINDVGQVVGVVTTTEPGPTLGVVFDLNRKSVYPLGYFSDLSGPSFQAAAHAINSFGNVVGEASGPDEFTRPFLVAPQKGQWHSDGIAFESWNRKNDFMAGLLLPIYPGTARDISETDIAVGWFRDETPTSIDAAVRWLNVSSSPQAEFLDSLAGPDQPSRAYAVNRYGDAVGESFIPGSETLHATLWKHDRVLPLDLESLGSELNDSVALDINDDQLIVGRSETIGISTHAVLWANGLVFDLNEAVPPDQTGWTLEEATAINEAGVIVGNGRRHGRPRGFILKPTEPPVEALDANYWTPWATPIAIEVQTDPPNDTYDFAVVVSPERGRVEKDETTRNRFIYFPPDEAAPGPAFGDQFGFAAIGPLGVVQSTLGTIRIVVASYQILEIEPPDSQSQGVSPRAVNNHGEVVGTFVNEAQSLEGFIWSESGGTIRVRPQCEGLGDDDFIAADITPAGRILGTLVSKKQPVFSSTVSDCERIPPFVELGLSGVGAGTNDEGDAVGYLTPTLQAYFWDRSANVLHTLETDPDESSQASAVNNQNFIVGEFFSVGGPRRPYLWSFETGRQSLATLGGPTAEAWDVSDLLTTGPDDFFVVGVAENRESKLRPVRWLHSESRVDLPEDLARANNDPSLSGTAQSINRRADVVGVFGHEKLDRAFLWVEDGFLLDLNLVLTQDGGWDRLEWATGINDLGWMVGIGVRTDGRKAGFVLKPSLAPRPPDYVDLDVDSDGNNTELASSNTLQLPDRSVVEEQLEDQKPKLLLANRADHDRDGIPGGFDTTSGDVTYTPMVLEVGTDYPPDLEGARVTLNYPGSPQLEPFGGVPWEDYLIYAATSLFRIWINAQAPREPANYIEPGRSYSLLDLGFDPSDIQDGDGKATKVLYVEGLQATSGLAMIEAVASVGGGPAVSSLGNGVSASAGPARDAVAVQVEETALGLNTAGERPGVPDVDFDIDVKDRAIKDQREGFVFWYAKPLVKIAPQVAKDDLVDFFPLSLTLPGSIAGVPDSQFYWEAEVEGPNASDVSLVIYPAIAGEPSGPPPNTISRRGFLQNDTLARRQLERIWSTWSDGTHRVFRSGEIAAIPDTAPGPNEFLMALAPGTGVPPERRITLKLVAGKPGLTAPGQGQVVDSIRITVRGAEDLWTLASARGEADVAYEYPIDRMTRPFSVRPTPKPGQGISGKDPASDSKTQKYLIAVHDGRKTPSTAAGFFDELFKRMYWVGFRGNFVGFDWPTRDFITPDTYPAFASDAFQVSPTFLDFLEETMLRDWNVQPADVDIVAHDVGNLVVMDALRIGASRGEGALAHNLIQLGSATWSEAYEAEREVVYGGPEPITYTVGELERHSWHHWFNRSGRPIRATVAGDFYNIHDSVDSALEFFRSMDFITRGCVPLPGGNGCVEVDLPDGSQVTLGFRWHFNREDVGLGSLIGPFVPVWRGPDWEISPPATFINFLGFMPTLIEPRDHRSSDYGMDDIGFLSGARPLGFADVNYDAEQSFPGPADSDKIGHHDFVDRPLPEVYPLFDDVFAGRAVGGAPIPLGER